MSSTRVHLKKLQLIDDSAIEALSPDELQALAKEWRRKLLEYQGILFRVKRRLFGRSSEKSAGAKPAEGAPSEPSKPRGETTKKPSERYPDAKVREEKIGFPESDCSACAVCGADAMADSGMKETSEYLDVEAKDFTVVHQVREKRRCTKCHASIVTAPLPPRVTPGGSYSDELIVDGLERIDGQPALARAARHRDAHRRRRRLRGVVVELPQREPRPLVAKSVDGDHVAQRVRELPPIVGR